MSSVGVLVKKIHERLIMLMISIGITI
jgi:hypothetical protein